MKYDIIIVGSGPAGSAAAYFNALDGQKVLLLDKSEFPRDKICGDGVTGKSLNILHEMGLKDDIISTREISCTGVIIGAPNKLELNIDIQNPNDPLSAFCIERDVLDNLLHEKAKEAVLENGGEVIYEKITDVLTDNNRIIGVKSKSNEWYSSKIIGAGGYNCPVSRFVLSNVDEPKQDRQHCSSAIREYWTGITGNTGEFEIHFIEGILPGYFWIFPLSENKFNIGVGMLLEDMDGQSIKLKQMLKYIVEESHLSYRFVDASAVPKTNKGWMLPLGSPRGQTPQPRRNFIEGCILIGDAATLIDPFTGEGIGNALVSGKLTAKYASFDDDSCLKYQTELWSMIGKELTNSHRLQKMLKKKWLVNWFIKKAKKKPALQEVLTDMLHNKESQSAFESKWFWIKTLLF